MRTLNKEISKKRWSWRNSQIICPTTAFLLLAMVEECDKNPQYLSTLSEAVDCFRQHSLDGHILCTDSPRYSTCNCVDQRMTALSKELLY